MADAVMLDIDGVLTVSWEALPGAVSTIRWLKEQGRPLRLLTNTSSRTRREIAGLLARGGMNVDAAHILTAVSAAAAYLSASYPGARCLVVNDGDLREDLSGVDVAEGGRADVVLLGGAGPGLSYRHLNGAFRLAAAGAPVVALHRNTRFQTADGPSLDMGAFIIGLERAAGMKVTVVGKPAATFFETAAASVDVDPGASVMVGDDLEADVLGAQAAGMTGVLVQTGKFRPSDLTSGAGRPDEVIEDIGHLPELLAALDGRPGRAR